jgi:hypothetical protein
MKNAAGTNGSVRDLTEEEGSALFDNAARFYLGISGENSSNGGTAAITMRTPTTPMSWKW